ncbi:hypothetical protein GCM10011512_26810 [Tersicoccus solisilvae]|uniref:HTH arsR-type domain-containing protein n=1 Tax=Tersicoccus solisilvae TaxID=1882339 RepID=A0ABQ1PKI5_9MICC|nr:helix-turn-helix domain-containing protein [Tersicoccus solisilvae]GGC98509.1 hypothetical protein GCM10011512_26810 [Tersicoccus solisilvae]
MSELPPTDSLPVLGSPDRDVSVESLKALGHPIRVQILNVLSQFGPQTSSSLAHRLGGTSGSFSYHLRQLARHDFIRELPDRGNARDRWWQRTPGGVSVNPLAVADNPAGLEAARVIVREWGRNRAELVADFEERGHRELPRRWFDASIVEAVNLQVGLEELEEINRAITRAVETAVAPYRNREPAEDRRAVQLQFSLFPILDGQSTGPVPPSPHPHHDTPGEER